MKGRVGRIIGATMLMVVAVSAAGWLGVWQYHAWSAHRAAEATDLTHETPRPLADIMGADDPFPGDAVGRPATVAGTWMPESTVLISQRRQGDVDGYWLVTPLTTGDAAAPAVPVVVGWTASAPPDPVALAPRGAGSVVGLLQPPEGSGAVDEDPTDDEYPQLRIADLAQRVEVDLYSAYAVLDPTRTEGAAALMGDLHEADASQMPEVGRFTAIRNLLYAVEWWFFGGFAAFLWWRFVSDERETARLERDDALVTLDA